MTYVECPREKNVPTVTGRCPVAINRRVMRSIAYSKTDVRKLLIFNVDTQAHRYMIRIKCMANAEGVR